MKLFVPLAIAATLFCCCSLDREVENVLEGVSSYIEERPFDALVALKEIPQETIKGKAARAQYSLLQIMALEGSRIPVTDLSMIQPAVEYYGEKGSASQKLRTFYYQGKIYLENGDTEGAMECFVKGLGEGDSSNDYGYKARTLYAKGEIHAIFRDYGKYVSQMLAAAEFFGMEGDDDSYFISLANAFDGCMKLEDSLQAGEIIGELASIADTSNVTQLSLLYEAKMGYSAKYNAGSSITGVIEAYKQRVPLSYVNWLSVAEASLAASNATDALEAVKMYGIYTLDKSERYYAVASKVYEALGYKEEALEHYRNYVKMSDSSEFVLLGKDTRFIEERYNLQMQAIKRESEKRSMFLYGLCFIMLLLGIIAYIAYRLKLRKLESETYLLQCRQLEQEKLTLSDTLENSWVISGPVKEIIKERLSLLNAVMAANISENDKIDKKAQLKIEQLLSDRKSFISSTVAAFEASHPHFIAHLKECGLSDMELGYCCLYAIGLNGKNVGEYTKMSRHYIINSEIRKKLRLEEHNMNLDRYIQQLL